MYLCRIQKYKYIWLRDLAHVLVLPLDGGPHRLCLGGHSVQDPVLLRQLRVETTAQVAQPGPNMSAMFDNVYKPSQYSSFLEMIIFTIIINTVLRAASSTVSNFVSLKGSCKKVRIFGNQGPKIMVPHANDYFLRKHSAGFRHYQTWFTCLPC